MGISCFRILTKLVPSYLSQQIRTCTMSKLHTFNWNTPEEIKIQLPQGAIAGKWWGPKNIRPILCLHGWQDNAGSFDALIPMLPKHVSYLAIDLPGHGHSFRYPSGIVYNFTDLPFLIKLIVDMYKWKKVSIISHSMAVFSSYLYAGILPDEVDLIISIDMLKPPYLDKNFMLNCLSRDLKLYTKLEKQAMSDTKPQAYTYEEAVERLVKGSKGSITKEAAPHLLKRGMAPSKLDTTKYVFTYDNRVKMAVIKMEHNEFVLMIAENMRVPYLCIKANSETPFLLESLERFNEGLALLKKSNPNFEFHEVQGTHHVHLTEPEKLSGIISEFISRIRPLNSEQNDINQNEYVNCKL